MKTLSPRIRRLALFLFVAIFTQDSFACIGGGEPVDISFSRDSRTGNLVASLRDGNRGTTEIEDDTGYVGMDLAVVHLVKSSREPSANGLVNVEKSKSTLEFLRSRASFFRSKINGLSLDSATKTSILTAIAGVERASAQTPLKGADLFEASTNLNKALSDAKINVSAASRRAGESNWSPERPVSSLGMPTAAMMRSIGGCNAGTNFNPSVGAGSAAPAGASGAGARGGSGSR